MFTLHLPTTRHRSRLLEGCSIAAADRIYSVNPSTGVISVTSATNGNTVNLPYSIRRTYTANRQYVNGSPVTRYGLEWVAEMPIINNHHTLGLSLRIDGKYYHYRGTDNTLIAGCPNGIGDQAEAFGRTTAYRLLRRQQRRISLNDKHPYGEQRHDEQGMQPQHHADGTHTTTETHHDNAT